MSTLLEALSDGSYDCQNKRDLSTDFSRNLLQYRDAIVNEYLGNDKTDLSASIARLAKAHALTDEQIKRVIEEVNNQVYLVLYNRMKQSPERSVKFNLADFRQVKGNLDEVARSKNRVISKKEASSEKKAMTFDQCFEKTASVHISEDLFADAEKMFCKTGQLSQAGSQKYMAQKIAEQYDSLQEKVAASTNQMFDHAYTLGSALLESKLLGADANAIFSGIAKTAKLTPTAQEFIKAACEDAITKYQSDFRVPENFKLAFETETNFEKSAFSLGKYSLSPNFNEFSVPAPSVSVRGRNLNNFDDYVKLAEEVQEDMEQYTEFKKAADDFDAQLEKGNLTMDRVRKIAEYGFAFS